MSAPAPLFYLFTTTDFLSPRSHELERHIAALRESETELGAGAIRSFILLQRASDADVEAFRQKAPSFMTVVGSPQRMSLSAARNVLLNLFAQEAGDTVSPDAIGAFPDDDAWYPPGALATLRKVFADAPQLDLAFCRYGSQPQPAGDLSAQLRPASLDEAVKNASSNTIFLRSGLLRDLGGFDENLGLGTPSGGGEDTDYAIRAYFGAKDVVYLDVQMIGHRDKIVEKRQEYFLGSLLAIAKNRGLGPAANRQYLRKIAVGVYYLLRRRMSLSTLVSAVRASLSTTKLRYGIAE